MYHPQRVVLGLLSLLAITLTGCIRLSEDDGAAPSTPVVSVVNPDYSTSVPCTLSVALVEPDGDDVALQLQMDAEVTNWSSYLPSGEPLLMIIDGSEVARETITIAARVRDTENHVSEFSVPQFLTFVNQAPFTPSGPTGSTTLLIGVVDTFTTSTSDPEHEDVSYRFDPGNGDVNVPWSPYYPGLFPIRFVYAYPMTGTFVMRAQARDPVGHTSAWSSGLSVRVINQPAYAGSVSVPGGALGVCSAGSYAYVVTVAAGLQVVDVSNPHNPQIIGAIGSFVAFQARRSGNTLLVLTNTPSAHDSVLAFDITNGSQPQFLASQGIDHAICLDAEGNYAAVGSSQSLSILDLSNPDSLHVVGAMNPGEIRGVALRFPYVYYVTALNVLTVADISVPSQPQEVASLTVPGAGPLCLAGARLRIASQGMLFVYDITTPQTPQFVAQRATHGGASGLHASEYFLAVAEGTSGFELYDISQSGRPPLVGQLPISPTCEGVFCGTSQLYVAAGSGGLRIYDYPLVDQPVAAKHSASSGDAATGRKLRIRLLSANGESAPFSSAGEERPGF